MTIFLYSFLNFQNKVPKVGDTVRIDYDPGDISISMIALKTNSWGSCMASENSVWDIVPLHRGATLSRAFNRIRFRASFSID